MFISVTIRRIFLSSPRERARLSPWAAGFYCRGARFFFQGVGFYLGILVRALSFFYRGLFHLLIHLFRSSVPFFSVTSGGRVGGTGRGVSGPVFYSGGFLFLVGHGGDPSLGVLYYRRHV